MILTLNELLYFHDLALREHGGQDGVHDMHMLESAIESPCKLLVESTYTQNRSTRLLRLVTGS